LIIDCHGHYTTAPEAHTQWRQSQLEAWRHDRPAPAYPNITDEDIRATLDSAQLKLQHERGTDLTIFSPRASAMAHHEGDLSTSIEWAQRSNDLIARVVALYPDNFVAGAQLPQAAGEPLDAAIAEARRVADLGFVGVNLNPDPSGGRWTSPPLTDAYWFPMYEALSDLQMPAMVHVSSTCTPVFHATGAHYLNADTTAFMQLLQGDLFARFPELRLVIPHGGGAVPYHWGRYRGLADMLNKPALTDHLMGNVFFDTCVYHQPGIDLLVDVIDTSNLLFGSEMVGAVRGIDPETGHYFDDTRRYIDAAELTEAEKAAIFSENATRVYPRIAPALKRQHQATA
jgi:4-oxalmesaconate hydratase